MTCEDGKKSEKKDNWVKTLVTNWKSYRPYTHNNFYFLPPYRALRLDRSLYLSQSLYVWCVVSEKKEMEEKKRQIEKKNVCLETQCVSVLLSPTLENHNTRGRTYLVDRSI